MTDTDFQNAKKRVAELRDFYINGTLEQRLGVIEDKLNNPAMYSNQVGTAVSAVEAFARALLLEHRFPISGAERTAEYGRIKPSPPKDLLNELAAAWPEFSADSRQVEEFALAVDFRNLILHECTSLQEGYATGLIEAATKMLELLKQAARARKFLR